MFVSSSRQAAAWISKSRRRSLPPNSWRRSGAFDSFPLFAGRKRHKTTDTASPELSWERFEFGDSPKWDDRFASNSRTMVVANEHELQQLHRAESTRDEQMSTQINQQLEAWQMLDPALVARATAILKPYVRPERVQRIQQVLQQRTQHVRFLFENPVNPSNVWACLRTLDAFGIQHVDVVLQSERYKGKAALSQKRGMRTAMGSAQWLSLRNHASTADAIAWLRSHGNFYILASDLSDRSKDIRQINWQEADMISPDDRPICIVMGNEESGISDEMRAAADGTFFLPMAGFCESFNLSVATAICAAHLSAASSSSAVSNDEESSASASLPRGPIRPGDLSPHEYNCLVLKGLLNSVAQKRMAYALLKQEGIVLPPEMNLV